MHDYVLTLLVTAAVTYVLTPLVRRLAVRAGAMHEARDRDVHVVPIPQWGGLAMYGGLAAGLLVADQIPNLRSNAYNNPGMVSGLLLAGALIVIIGMIDDRWGMAALTKLAGQIAAGAILVATGTQLTDIPYPGGGTFVLTTNQATVATILVVVVTINAVNFIDGLDGLAAGIVAIAAVSYFLYYYSMTNILSIGSLASPALASAVLIGMCLGFLPHNFYPARIFMGDTGAMLLGLLLAYAPISGITLLNPGGQVSQFNRYPEIMPILLPGALLVIPYADLVLAVVRRTRAGTSLFAADRKHLHHRLLDIGHSQRTSVLIMYFWAALFSGSVAWLSIERTQRPGVSNHHGNPLLVFVGITAAAVIVLLLLSMPQLRFWNRGRQSADVRAAPSPDQPAMAAVTPAPVAPAPVAASAASAASAEHSGQPDPERGDAEPAAQARARSVVGYVPPAVALAAARAAGQPRAARPAALPHEANGAALPHEANGAALPGEANGAALPGEANGAALPGEANGAALPHAALQNRNGRDHDGLPVVANGRGPARTTSDAP